MATFNRVLRSGTKKQPQSHISMPQQPVPNHAIKPTFQRGTAINSSAPMATSNADSIGTTPSSTTSSHSKSATSTFEFLSDKFLSSTKKNKKDSEDIADSTKSTAKSLQFDIKIPMLYINKSPPPSRSKHSISEYDSIDPREFEHLEDDDGIKSNVVIPISLNMEEIYNEMYAAKYNRKLLGPLQPIRFPLIIPAISQEEDDGHIANVDAKDESDDDEPESYGNTMNTFGDIQTDRSPLVMNNEIPAFPGNMGGVTGIHHNFQLKKLDDLDEDEDELDDDELDVEMLLDGDDMEYAPPVRSGSVMSMPASSTRNPPSVRPNFQSRHSVDRMSSIDRSHVLKPSKR